MLFEVIQNPLLSLTTNEIAEVGKWLDVMGWRGKQVCEAQAKVMVEHIVSKDPRLEFFVITCPIPAGV